MKRTFHFENVDKWLENRNREVRKTTTGWDDAWATDDKGWVKENLDGFFSCKFCGKRMYKHDYNQGVITVSCKTPLCPGNADHDMKNRAELNKLDIRKMTNQYLFNSMMKF